MTWLPFSSFFRKSKPDPATDDGVFYPHADETSKTRHGNRKDEPVDPALPEKKRARRRLVGAIALTLGLVIALPMVLDSEPKPVSDDIVIRIPSRDKPSRASMASRSASTASAAVETKSEPAPAPTEPATAVAAKPPAADAAVKSAAANGQKTEAKPAEPKAKEHESKTAAKQPAEPARNPPADGKVIIQVAALASQQKVNELQAQLKGAGIKSYSQKVATAGGERIRVRVGPFGSKSEAQQTCAKLGKMRLNCTILPG
ncbi:MAG: SPOR domain-containing protein [Burkholderiaceae bacterium]|nr:SPOR domain-containing protein [Burkholderiaceae bacterium]